MCGGGVELTDSMPVDVLNQCVFKPQSGCRLAAGQGNTLNRDCLLAQRTYPVRWPCPPAGSSHAHTPHYTTELQSLTPPPPRPFTASPQQKDPRSPRHLPCGQSALPPSSSQAPTPCLTTRLQSLNPPPLHSPLKFTTTPRTCPAASLPCAPAGTSQAHRSPG